MIAGITGHQGLDERTSTLVRAALEDALRSTAATSGVSSLAEGADQLFGRAVIRTGGTLDVIVPCNDYAKLFEGRTLGEYRELVGLAAATSTLPFPAPTEEAFLAAGLLIVERCEILMAVWDGQPSRGLGGTADIVAYARQIGREVLVLWPEGSTRG